ncbi:MAG: hypothetical protein GXP43_03570 [bacterium]|nr:hypothetical protein [bacterium]
MKNKSNTPAYFIWSIILTLAAGLILSLSISYQAFTLRYLQSAGPNRQWITRLYFHRILDKLTHQPSPDHFLSLGYQRLNEADYLWQHNQPAPAKQQLQKAVIYFCRANHLKPQLQINPRQHLPAWFFKLSPSDNYYWWIRDTLSRCQLPKTKQLNK